MLCEEQGARRCLPFDRKWHQSSFNRRNALGGNERRPEVPAALSRRARRLSTSKGVAAAGSGQTPQVPPNPIVIDEAMTLTVLGEDQRQALLSQVTTKM